MEDQPGASPKETQRRGSAISIAVSRPPGGQPANLQTTQQQPPQMNGAAQPMYGAGWQQYPQYAPNYPVLMNPPPMPTFQYGIPPQPMPMYGPPMTPMNVRRSPSLSGRMIGQDPNRKSYGAPSEADYGIEANGYTVDTPDGAYEIKKLDDDGQQPHPPYPGVVITEMMDSASVAGENQDKDKHESFLEPHQLSATIPQKAPVRWKHSSPMNTCVLFVPQQEAWVVERMGKYHRILEPGLNVLIPLLDKIKYVQRLKEMAIDIPQQTAITIDNVTLNIDGVLYLRVIDPYKASYGVEDPEFAITQLAQTTMRSEIGKINLDTLFKERDNLNRGIVAAINQASEPWGIDCMRYEIRDIKMPSRVQEAMQMQVEAERKKRAAILESEGIKTAEINVAEGKKQSRILASEAEKQELINAAQGAAEAVVAAGQARARSIEMVSKSLCSDNGQNAANLAVAEKYVTAFQSLAKTNNTLILPANTGDVTGMVAQAMSIYSKLQKPVALESVPEEGQDNDGANPDIETIVGGNTK